MAMRFYLLPKIGTGLGTGTGVLDDPFRPAYVSSIAGVVSSVDYGKEPWTVVAADVTPAEHTAITSHADATALPANLDNTIGGALATVQAALETANIPADWVTAGMTYRFVLKQVIRACFLMQRFRRLDRAAQRLFSGGITLNSTLGAIPEDTRQKVRRAAEELGLDTSGLTLATTIRVALRILAQQLTVDLIFGSEVL